MKRNILLPFAVLAILAVALRFTAAKDADEDSFVGKDVFTKVNMRYDPDRQTGSFIQYLNLTLLPANSPVRIRSVNRKGFVMNIPDPVRFSDIRVDYRPEWGGGKSVEEILPTLFSHDNKSIATSIDKLSKKDQKGIRLGRAIEGMSKAGVIVALGPLALHKTPSEELDSWTFWANRIIFFHVTFKDDKVVEVGAAGR